MSQTLEAEDKGEGLPQLRKVLQMLAVGGAGIRALLSKTSINYCVELGTCSVSDPEEGYRQWQQTTPDIFIDNCRRFHRKGSKAVLKIEDFEDLLDCALPDRIVAAVKRIADAFDPQVPEELVVLAFLLALLKSSVGGGRGLILNDFKARQRGIVAPFVMLFCCIC